MKCRHCKSELKHVFLDLGYAPTSNGYLRKEALQMPEITYPLKINVCNSCWLVQTEDYNEAEQLFSNEYAYFSSTSVSWLQHAAKYSEMITTRLGLTGSSFVVEVASNDGYLLTNFLANGIPCLGIEPTDSTADEAEKKGIPVLRKFFGVEVAKELIAKDCKADLICGNNVYAHVPDINDFTLGLSILLKSTGTVNLEFPHLLRLIEGNQFDTVYHEHFSYLSLTAVSQIFDAAGLRIFDVEELPTHGGSLRIYGCHLDDARKTTDFVYTLLENEKKFGLKNLDTYKNFQLRANKVKDEFLDFLLKEKKNGKKIIGYGAAAKGNTLMNYAGIKNDIIAFICDAATSKQGKYTPGSHIQILHPSAINEYKPDIVIIFPWNIADEVMSQFSYIRDWGGKFVVAVPELKEYK